jgi:hypothetical protein
MGPMSDGRYHEDENMGVNLPPKKLRTIVSLALAAGLTEVMHEALHDKNSYFL